MRLARAKTHPITCETSEATQEGTFLFTITGTAGDRYIVEVEEDVELWPPRCSCEDNLWRPDVFCKHIVYCLLRMGVEERVLGEWHFEPSQEELYMILMNASDVVHGL